MSSSWAQLVKEAIDYGDLTPEKYAEEMKVSRATVYRWLGGKVSVNKLKTENIISYAKFMKVPVGSVYSQLGISLYESLMSDTETVIDVDKFRLYPLIEQADLVNNKHLHNAIHAAIRARQLYFFDGDMNAALVEYEEAAREARRGNALRLATYLDSYVCNLLWMTGRIKRAKQMFKSVFEAALQIQIDAKKMRNPDLYWLGRRLAVHAQLRQLWAEFWATGASEQSIEQGLRLIRELIKVDFYQRIPYVYEFLARCALDLGRFDEAIMYATKGTRYVYRLSKARFYTRELFLDAGREAKTGLDYRRQIDHILETKLDILIAGSRIEEALEVYQRISSHRPPKAYLSLHHWSSLPWQLAISKQVLLIENIDPKLGYDFYGWNEQIESTGNLRVLALTLLSQAQNYEARNLLLEARGSYRLVFNEIAPKCKAIDLIVRSGIGIINIAARENSKDLARATIKALEEGFYIRDIYNDDIIRKYKLAQETVAQI